MSNNSSIPPVQLKYLAGIAWVNFIALISVFPFYVHVFQMNRERDKTTPVFPIINQIYKSIKMVYIQFAVTLFLGYAFDPTEESRYFWVGCAAVLFEFCWMRIFCNVCYLLLILQAFQKFLIYFCPRIEKYVTLSERVVERIFWSAHVLMFPIILFEMFHGSFSFTYIPTFFQDYNDRWTIVATWQVADTKRIPLIIQLAYLGCNRRNLQAFLNSLNLKNVFKVVCCPWRQRSQVEVQPINLSRSSTGAPVY
ncbi:hypothetical protein CRE_23518 [Caenorhabditis remanei]|uniref:Serpentine Receptor, class Z n=1 Tax=Caenorhabditis remanei TaxID=31234 RepID=E3MH57_CAERE|nr:hypothetical protein CRE_23518 [Caenorhabditis remanei]